MLRVLFTSDYELFANGRGCPRRHMVEPTNRMLSLLDDFGAKLTLQADVPEIIRFGDFWRSTGHDDYHYQTILEQLRRIVQNGHDVQLHLHSSYFKARHIDGYWHQYYQEFDLARLPYADQVDMLKRCKAFLETELVAVKPDYRCFVFRAPNWSMQPSKNILRALIDTGFEIDTSVWKYGLLQTPVQFDYRAAHSDLIPWPVAKEEVCKADLNGRLFEFPIYCESQKIWRFLSWHRLWRALDRWVNPIWHDPELRRSASIGATTRLSGLARLNRWLNALVKSYPLKMDFNQCTGRQILAGLQRAEACYGHLDLDLPFVIFGHSRTFTRANAASLRPLLKAIANQHERFQFAVFGDFELARYRRFATDGS